MRNFLLILPLFWVAHFFGQDVTFVSDFELVEVQGGVFVNWEIDSGYTCQGVDVLRSEDGINFTEIGHISGVCGSLSKSVPYSFLDEEPISNSTNYYRLRLNGFGFTEILSIDYIAVSENGVLVYPNPASTEEVNVKMDNANQEMLTVQLISTDGRVWLEQVSSGNTVVFSAAMLQKGIYQVRILNEDQTVQRLTKLMIY